MFSDTIAAIATPLGGEGSVGVVRISGKDSLKILNSIFKPSSKEEALSHKVRHGWIVDNPVEIDEVMAAYMASPRTYTGEDVVEISCHGGSAVLMAVLELAIREGARLANRGEFTKRAFLNGKIDLAQAEAVIDLIKAKTREGSRVAASHLKGNLSSRIRDIRGQLLDLLAEMEASIDFPDEIPDVDLKNTQKTITKAAKDIEELIETSDAGKIYREGVSVAIIGRPNVGKSSLLNALLREERAIVTEEPGTTRDVIEETLNIKGIPVRIIDTAGIRHSDNRIEKIGINRAVKELENADLVLLVIDSSQPLQKEDQELLEKTKNLKRITVLNKSDLPCKVKESNIQAKIGASRVSALKGDGIGELESDIFKSITVNKVVAENMEVMINLRHKEALEKAKASIEKTLGSIQNGMQADFISIDIKGALAALGEVTGETASEEIIDQIFERFCVGK